MKAATLARIHRRTASLSRALAYAESVLLHEHPIGRALAKLDGTLSPVAFAWMLEVRRDDLAMTLDGFRDRITTQVEVNLLLSILHKIPQWSEPGTFRPGARRRLLGLESWLKTWGCSGPRAESNPDNERDE